MPENMAAIPHASKIRILSDMSNAGIEGPSTKNLETDHLLYRGFAHGAGFGVRKSFSDFQSHVAKSAKDGCHVASLVSKCLINQDNRMEVLTRAFREALDSQMDEQNSNLCQFRRQTSDTVEASSFSSLDGCNILHYLPALKGISSGSKDTIVKKNILGSKTRRQRTDQISELRKLIKRFGPSFVNSTTSTAHYIHSQFPLSFTGTPLAFAVVLGCEDSVEALLLEGAEPLDPLRTMTDKTSSARATLLPSSTLHVAVSCHRWKIFHYLWTRASSLNHRWLDTAYDLLFNDVTIGAGFVSALAARSILERMVLHGPNRKSAQSNMIQAVFKFLVKLATLRSPEQARNLVVELLSKGAQDIVRLGDLDVATEIMTLLSSLETYSHRNVPLDIENDLRLEIVDTALRTACSGSLDPEQSIQFLSFAKNIIKDYDVDTQAIKMMSSWNCGSLFQHYLENGLWKHDADKDGRILLHHAISTGFCRQFPMSTILNTGINVNIADHEGNTPLHLAATLGMLETVTILLNSGAEPMAVDETGFSILHRAALSGELAIFTQIFDAIQPSKIENRDLSDDQANMILDFGNKNGVRPQIGRSILHCGIMSGNCDIVEVLLSHGANVNLEDAQGETPLHYAIDFDNVAKSQVLYTALLKAGADPLKENNSRLTPFHKAVARSHSHHLSAVLDCFITHAKCDVDSRDPESQTILHHAVASLSKRSVATTLAFGASADIPDAQGWTPLHICTQTTVGSVNQNKSWRAQTSIAIADRLLDAGANARARDLKGLCPLDFAAINGNELLLAHLAVRIQRPSEPRQLPLSSKNYQAMMSSAWSLAIQKEQWRVVKSLLTFQPPFEKAFSLLKWPAGAHFLKFMAESGSSLPPGVVIPGSFSTPLSIFHPHLRLRRPSDPSLTSKNPLQRKSLRKALQWEHVNTDLKYGQIPWLSDKLRRWDNHVEKRDVHFGGNILREILEFIEKWDLRIFMAYFGDSATALLDLYFGKESNISWQYSSSVKYLEGHFRFRHGNRRWYSEFLLAAIEYGTQKYAGRSSYFVRIV